ncbi:DUF6344 domain-containing protein [Actinacidiphila paucisporea]|uniref:Uncharacterized protein n=1 Tax=Actinacidiphila paucisporea TaxID=310782 RepID=A0A1M7CJB0_9ACTN|nr:DUF6344 domain-containing protein [Actinacidiphila paucisporea]SHL66889.1 hypothetical protein SAMN05216499_105246 [Actinacidiphila paucisporea]
MAATTPRVIAFWGAFLNVLIKCIAALGFATPARMKGAAPRPAAGHATVPAQAVATRSFAGAAPRGGDPARGHAAPAHSASRVVLPAPRSSERGRSLPPTMKQRIRAEAHGTSPSSRSIAVPADGLGDVAAVAAATAGAAEQAATAGRAGRRRDRALCG